MQRHCPPFPEQDGSDSDSISQNTRTARFWEVASIPAPTQHSVQHHVAPKHPLVLCTQRTIHSDISFRAYQSQCQPERVREEDSVLLVQSHTAIGVVRAEQMMMRKNGCTNGGNSPEPHGSCVLGYRLTLVATTLR